MEVKFIPGLVDKNTTMTRAPTKTSLVRYLCYQMHQGGPELPKERFPKLCALLSRKKLSRGVIKAILADSALAPSIEKALKTNNNTLLPNGLTWLEIPTSRGTRTILATIDEAEKTTRKSNSAGSENSVSINPQQVYTPTIQLINRTAPTTKGGLITAGKFILKVDTTYPNAPCLKIRGRTAEENLNIKIKEFLSNGDVPQELEIEVQEGKLIISYPEGPKLTQIPSNNPKGLAIASLTPYLFHISKLSGYIHRKVGSRGLFYIGTEKIVLEAKWANTNIIVNFAGTQIVIADETGNEITSCEITPSTTPHKIASRISRDNLLTICDKVTRKTSPEGAFRLANTYYYLGAEYGGQEITISIDQGIITGIEDEAGSPIPLSELHLLPIYNNQGEVKHLIPAKFHCLQNHFFGTSGWLKIELDKPSEGGRWHFAGEEKKLLSGYDALYAKIHNGVVLEVQYFKEADNAPWNASYAKQEVYKRVYSLRDSRGTLQKSFVQIKKDTLAWLRKNNGRVSHWKTGNHAMIMINRHHLTFKKGLANKYLILDFCGDIATYYVYDKPLVRPNDYPLEKGTINLETGEILRIIR